MINTISISKKSLILLLFLLENINFLIADGKRFAHPLGHLDKSLDDLPVIAIDSFRHMYLFPNYNDLHVPGKLKQFVADLHNGKLHREFHFGPDPVSESKNSIEASPDKVPHEHPKVQPTVNINANDIDKDVDMSSPPDSTFIKLAPSDQRYTIVPNDEL